MDVAQLKRIPLFADAPDEELQSVAYFAEAKEVPEGTVLMNEDGFSNELMAIEEGTADVSRDGERLAELGPGDVFGEAGIVHDEQRNATVTTTSRVKLISMGTFEVARLRSRAPGIYKRVEELAGERDA